MKNDDYLHVILIQFSFRLIFVSLHMHLHISFLKFGRAGYAPRDVFASTKEAAERMTQIGSFCNADWEKSRQTAKEGEWNSLDCRQCLPAERHALDS